MSYSISPTKRSQPCLECRPRWKKLLDLGKCRGKYKVSVLKGTLDAVELPHQPPPMGSRLASGRSGSTERFSSLSPSLFPQSCLSRQQLLAAIRQMQQLLKGQETRFSEGLRAVRSRLSTIHASLTKAAPELPAGESLGEYSREIAGKEWLGRIRAPSKLIPFPWSHSLLSCPPSPCGWEEVWHQVFGGSRGSLCL